MNRAIADFNASKFVFLTSTGKINNMDTQNIHLRLLQKTNAALFIYYSNEDSMNNKDEKVGDVAKSTIVGTICKHNLESFVKSLGIDLQTTTTNKCHAFDDNHINDAFLKLIGLACAFVKL